MKKVVLTVVAGLFIFGSLGLQAEQTGDCTAGEQYCEQNSLDTTISGGNNALLELCNMDVDVVLNAITGYKGLHLSVELLENQDLKWIGIQLDIRSIIESNEDIQQILRQQNYIHHAHTGNPGLKVLGGTYEKEHRFIASELRKAKYSEKYWGSCLQVM